MEGIMTNATTLMLDERTDYEKGPELAERAQELERVLRSVLSVIDSMQTPKELPEIVADEEERTEEEVTINDQHWFGTFANWREHQLDVAGYDVTCVVEWPDLAWAKDQIVKALGS